MKIEISFNTENAAFEDNFEAELLHIMRQVSIHADAMVIVHRSESGVSYTDKLRDSNGNSIGTVTITQD